MSSGGNLINAADRLLEVHSGGEMALEAVHSRAWNGTGFTRNIGDFFSGG